MDEPTDVSGGNSYREPGDATGGTQSEAAIRAEIQADYESKLKSLIENNEAYRSMQRVVSGKDREIQDLRRALEEVRSTGSSMAEGFEFLSETMMRNMPDDERDRIKAELNDRRLRRIEDSLTKQVQPAPAQPQGWDQEALERQWQQVRREAQESLEETAREFGVDPRSKGLDYGGDGEPFPARLKKLNASLKAVKKAQEEAEVESVRKKPAPDTRTSGGAAVGDDVGKNLAELGFKEMWSQMQNPTYRAERMAGRHNKR